MHFHGPIIRPQTDALNSTFLEVTVGCSHDQCKFCSFYDGYPFRMAPLEQIEADLKEIAQFDPNTSKIWASGGNPYVMNVKRLATIGQLIRQYLPKARISTYAHVNDVLAKSVEEIAYLKTQGYVDIVIGIESADDAVLQAMNKGYTVADIREAFARLEAAAVDYRIIYLGGLAGKGRCVESAQKTAAVLNDFCPKAMILTTVAILPGTELYAEWQAGLFEAATEKERVEEFRALVAGLQNDIHIFAQTSTDFVGFTAQLQADKADVLAQLDAAIADFTPELEARLSAFRAQMTQV